MHLRAYAYGIAAAVFAADRITKAVIRDRVGVLDTHAVIPGLFNIIHTENPGAAFSILADAHSLWRTVFLIVLSAAALTLVAVLLWRAAGHGAESRWMRLGLALILGGAFGNMYDRIVHGTVTDFLEVYYGDFHWPAFNVADSAITIGAGLVILDMLRNRRAPQAT